MKISRIESFADHSVCIVKVTSEDGAFGFGQTAPFEADISQLVLHRQVAPLAIGEDDADFGLADAIIARLYKYAGTYVCRAVAGIDTALWDLKGRRADKSVRELLGGTRTHVQMYYSSMVRDSPIEWEAERIARLKAERGYRAFKLHVGKWISEGADYWPGRTESMIELAAQTLCGDGDIYLDANGAFSHDWAMRMAPLMRESGVVIVEEPLPYWKVKETAALRDALRRYGISTAGGEQDYSAIAWDLILDLPMADIVQPDIGYIGGFTRALQVAQRAADRGLYTTPHTSNRSMLLPFGLHFTASIEKPWPFMEHGVEDDAWVGGAVADDLAVVDGKIEVPDGPGWGVEPARDWMKGAQKRETAEKGA